MKKVGTIFLTIYLTIVTIACGLFGYLYFSTTIKNSKDNNLDWTSARVLVNTVCRDMGLISQEQFNEAVGAKAEAATTTFTLKDVKSDLDYVQMGYYNWSEAYLTMARALFDSNAKAGLYYKDVMPGNAGMKGDITYATYNIIGNAVIVKSWDKQTKGTGMSEETFLPVDGAVEIRIEKTENGWNFSGFMVDHAVKGNVYVLRELSYRGTTEKGFASAHAVIIDYEGDTIPTKFTTEDLEKLSNYHNYVGDLETGKREFRVDEKVQSEWQEAVSGGDNGIHNDPGGYQKRLDLIEEVVEDNQKLGVANQQLSRVSGCDISFLETVESKVTSEETNFFDLLKVYQLQLNPLE